MSKLETRLLEYEKNRQISSDSEFVAALEAIIAEESKKRSSRRDFELLEEAVSILTSLQTPNVDALEAHAAEVTKAAVYTATREEEKHYIPMRRLIPIAAAVLLLAAGMVTSYALDYFKNTNWLAEDAIEDIKRMESGKVYIRDGSDVIVSKEIYSDIDSLEKLSKTINIPDLLLPVGLSDKYYIDDICVDDLGIGQVVEFTINGENEKAEFVAETNSSWQVDIKKTPIAGFEVFISEFDGYYQGEFEFKNTIYNIRTSSEKELYKIIESLEVIK